MIDSVNILARKPSTVEERSDAIVNKLEVLDQRLASKVCHREVLHRPCYPVLLEKLIDKLYVVLEASGGFVAY